MVLAGIIVPVRKDLEAVAVSQDRRMLPDSIAWSFAGNNDGSSEQKRIALESADLFCSLFF